MRSAVKIDLKYFLLVITVLLAACMPEGGAGTSEQPLLTAQPVSTITSIPMRPEFEPGELVDYIAQTGDTLPALAAHFNTTIQEIREANPIIPADASSMPPGMPMKIPIYYLPFLGTSHKILPDSLFINGPAAINFDTRAFVAGQPGWLKDFRAYVERDNHSGAEIVDIVATNYSLSPRLLLAILEYQIGALSMPEAPRGSFPLGEVDYARSGLYLQLIWAANILNNGYYGWRTGSLTQFELTGGAMERPDPWQNAATVGLQYYFLQHSSMDGYQRAIGPDGLKNTYELLFGDPWAQDMPHIPVSLYQPELTFPFPQGDSWTMTGGPHPGWGSLLPWAALDFAPPAVVGGCIQTTEAATAMADGVVVRSVTGVVMLDLDRDGDERTGWNILYLHVATDGRAAVGQVLKTGDAVGFPSCEGGTATGTHVHIARKYNGEWIPVDSIITFTMDGWTAHAGPVPYQGTLTRGNRVVTACECSDAASMITAGK
jgi:LasA protease